MKPLAQMTPEEWLTHVRRQYCPSLPFRINLAWLIDFISKLPIEHREKAQVAWLARDGHSVYEIHDELMEHYKQHLKSALNPEETNALNQLFLAILPTFEFEAYRAATPRGDQLIIFHDAFGYIVNYWAGWYLRVHEDGPKFLLQNIAAQESILKQCTAIWVGTPREMLHVDRFPIKEDSWCLKEHLTFASLVFVLAHELGHFMLGHVDYVSEKLQNHKTEFEADAFALRILVRYAINAMKVNEEDSYYAKFGLFAPFFILCVTSLFGDSESDTHPSPTQRAEALSMKVESTIHDILGVKAEEFLDYLDGAVPSMLMRNYRRCHEALSLFRPTLSGLAQSLDASNQKWRTLTRIRPTSNWK